MKLLGPQPSHLQGMPIDSRWYVITRLLRNLFEGRSKWSLCKGMTDNQHEDELLGMDVLDVRLVLFIGELVKKVFVNFVHQKSFNACAVFPHTDIIICPCDFFGLIILYLIAG